MSFSPFSPARAFRPFGAGSPGVWLGTPVNALITFESGTAGDIITPALLNASTVGAAPGTWGYEGPDPLLSTRVSGQPFNRRTPLACNGVSYQGGGTRGLVFDLTEATGGGDPWEGVRWIPPVVMTNLSVTALMKFKAVGSASFDVAIDHIMIVGGAFAILQQKITSAQFSGDPTTAGHLTSHGQTSGGVSTFGFGIPIQADHLYSVTLRSNADDNVAEIIILDGVTGKLIGMASCVSAMDTVSRVVFQNYLSFNTGENLFDTVGFDWTNAAFPVEPLTLDAPSSVEGEIVNPTTVVLLWYSTARFCRVERNRLGVWSVLEEDQVNGTYTDSGYEAGDTYRITAKVYQIESPPSDIITPIDSDTEALFQTPIPGATGGIALVGGWPDAFGAYTWTNVSSEPVYLDGILNGFPIVRLDGTKQFNSGGPSSSDYPISIILVVKRGVSLDALRVILGSTNTGGFQWATYHPTGDPGIGSFVRSQDVGEIGANTTKLPVNGWVCLAAVVTATTWAMYYNGAPDGSGANAEPLTPGRTFTLGVQLPADDSRFIGDIAYARIFTRELGAPEIASRCAALVAKYGL